MAERRRSKVILGAGSLADLSDRLEFLNAASRNDADLVASLTTNCTWTLTRIMVTRLVDALGEAAPSGRRAFPTPAAMAKKNEKFYRDVVRAGYRSPHLAAIARDPGLKAGVNTYAGKLTYEAVATAQNLEYTPVDEMLGGTSSTRAAGD